MVKFIMKRLTLMIPLLIVVTFMTFMMTYLTNERSSRNNFTCPRNA